MSRLLLTHIFTLLYLEESAIVSLISLLVFTLCTVRKEFVSLMAVFFPRILRFTYYFNEEELIEMRVCSWFLEAI